jgi:hypothetical protein
MKPETGRKASERSNRMRTGIIAMVDASPYVAQRRPRKLMILGSCALVVGGLVVGGGVSAAAFATSNDSHLQSDLKNDARYSVSEGYGTLVGRSHYVQATARTQIRLGEAPHGATSIEIAFQCLDAGVFTLSLDGASRDENCDTSPNHIPSTRNTKTESLSVGSRGNHVVTIDPHGSNGYALWVSFLKPAPLPKPSAQQRSDVADGKISLDEYVNAFSRYEGCMAEAGFPQPVMSMTDGQFDYGTAGASTTASDTRCYPREFEEVDTLWQSQGEK